MGKRRREKKQIFLDMAEQYRGSAQPACQHFGKCGGCLFQDVSYENQLKIKQEFLSKLLNNICDVDEVKPSTPFGYRNRMDFVAAFGKRGLRERGNFKHVIDIEQCPLMQENSNKVWTDVRELLADVEDYNYLSHHGYLRYTILRQAMFTGQVMCNFVLSKKDNLIQNVIDKLAPKVDSMSLLLSDGIADVSFGPVIEHIKTGHIEEHFGDVKYTIYPNSFFQSNSKTAVEMYSRIKEEVNGKVLDLYSGVGSISLFIADKAESVTGIELVEEAVESANHNKELNNIKNVDFVCSDARPYMRENANKYDTLVVDPPRSGINPRMIKYIEALAAPKIVYMSCNPVTFKDNFEMLENYEIEKFEAYDMFPQTPHVESLAVLKRKG